MNRKCPTCGAAELVHDTRDRAYSYQGESTTLSAVTADWCPACGESVTDPTETRRTMALMLAWNSVVNARQSDMRETYSLHIQ